MPVELRSVLAISDLTEASEPAVAAAARVAADSGARLHVVCPLGIMGQPLREAMATLPQLQERVERARRALEDRLRGLVAEDAPRACIVDLNRPAAALARQVAELQPDLVVLAPDRGGEFADPAPLEVMRRLSTSVPTAALVMGDAVPPKEGKMVVAAHPGRLDYHEIERIERWITRLRRAWHPPSAVEPRLTVEIVVVDDDAGERDVWRESHGMGADMVATYIGGRDRRPGGGAARVKERHGRAGGRIPLLALPRGAHPEAA